MRSRGIVLDQRLTARRQALLRFALLALPVSLASGQPSSTASSTQPAKAEKEPDCSHCQERLKTIEALRQKLPAEWTFRLEREPVFQSDMLVVQAGQTNAQTVMLVHGLGQNGFTDWLPVLPQLARRYHVIAMDLPGFGYSGVPLGKYSPTHYARVLQGLLKRHGKEAPIVVGHSMGGAAALRLASEYPLQVSKLVLVDAAGILHRTAFAKHGASLPLSVESLPAILKEPVARAKEFGNTVVERIFGLPGDPTRLLRQSDLAWEHLLRNRTNMNAAMALVDEDFCAAIQTLRQPTQLIWGEADTVAPLRTGQLLARRLPTAQLRSLPGVGHTPMLTASETFLALLNSALVSDPVPAPAQGREPGQDNVAADDLKCSGLVDQQVSGRYREVLIERCSALRLTDLRAERIVIRDSIVQMHDVQIRAADVALEIVNSELIATVGEFSGDTAIRSDASRLDLAGVNLTALRTAVDVKRRSRVIASICQISSPDFRGHWHDSVELEEARLVPARRGE